MAPKHHSTPLSGGDRKALNKELGKARAMTNILAAQSAEMRAKAETMLQQADRLLCESWNERMWSAGEPIDQKDNERRTALAYALRNGDLGAARRLLALRARPDTPVGYEDMPVALIPVTTGNIEGIRLMREFGVDYSKLRYRGATAFDFAKQMGNSAMLEALGHASTTL